MGHRRQSGWLCLCGILVVSCSSGGNGDGSEEKLSSGLKIFVTDATHVADFANDPNLVGNNGIEKADDFCNIDANTPDNAEYKALLVDGLNRDAPAMIDWVLQPNTTYYRTYFNIPIGTTNDNAIFDVVFGELENSIAVDDGNPGEGRGRFSWTGIDDVRDFSTQNSCHFWSSTDATYLVALGFVIRTTESAFSAAGLNTCSLPTRYTLYCVEQPAP